MGSGFDLVTETSHRLGPRADPGQAALFDDIMGALQLVIDKSGYTRSLLTEYLAALPVGEPVEFLAYEIDAEPGLFGVEAEAWSDGRIVARSTGIFTRITAGGFMKPVST